MSDQLLLIRHGETEWARVGRHTGRTDIPLTDRGREEARLAANTLEDWSIEDVFTSPLIRARETAELVGLGDRAVVDDRIVEWDYGEYEGQRTLETRETIPGWSVWTHPIHGGESIEDVGDRADAFLQSLEQSSGNTVVFAHGHFLAILIARWCDLPPVEGRRFALATATVSLLGQHREHRVVRAINHRCGDQLHPPART